jgi:hypothetical protein
MRILELAFYFITPFAFLIIGLFWEKISITSWSVKVFFIILSTLSLTTSVYGSFPRHDRYLTGRSFNLSTSDEAAVEIIAQDAGEKNFVVLANQITSAASLKKYGFEHSLTMEDGNSYYFYPLPTSSPLYRYYLEYVYEDPGRKTMEAAMKFAKVNTAYVVLNDYWNDFSKIVPRAEKTANRTWSINGGKVVIFKYEASRFKIY